MKLSAELRQKLQELKAQADELMVKEGVKVEEINAKADEIKVMKAKLEFQIQKEADEEEEIKNIMDDDAASKRTDEVVAEIPRPMHEQAEVQQLSTIEVVPPELKDDSVTEKGEDIVINTDVTNGTEHHFQKPEEQPLKPKQLTKKQLEKKFKDELQRVKDKSEIKK